MNRLNYFGLLCAVLFAFGFTPEEQTRAADETVVASSFGYDAADATDCLQKAINSGAKRVVVDRQAGPWIVRPIALRSNLELVLQEGVEILAKAGEFKSKGETLITAQNAENIVIRGEGEGATLRMRKKDYWNAPYEKSEWRHGLSLRSAAHVTVENLTIAETGGDGVYVGVATEGVPCRDITLRNVDCVANNRQGISVISVDGLLIEDCVLRDTVGTAPEAGIDFEPNHADEQISNVVMRRVLAINNRGDGIAFYLPQLKNLAKKELSFTFEDCKSIRNNRAGLSLTVGSGEDRLLNGAMLLRNCEFTGNFIGIAVRSKWADGAPLRFEKVRVTTPSAASVLGYGEFADYDFNVVTDAAVGKWQKSTTDMGVSFIAVGTDVDANGGVSFEDVEIVDADAAAPEFLLAVRDASSEGVGFRKFAGAIRATKLNADGTVKSSADVPVDDAGLKKLFPQLSARRVEAFDLAALNSPANAKLAQELAAAWRERADGAPNVRARGDATYYFCASAGETVEWRLQQRQIGNYAPAEVKSLVTAPSGKEIALETAPGDCQPHDFTFNAEESGWFKLDVHFGASTVELSSKNDAPLLISARPTLDVFATAGTFSFYVPEGAADLGLRVIGSASERVTATVYDPTGKEIAKLADVSSLGTWSVAEDANGKPIPPMKGFWSVKFEKPSQGVLEDYIVTVLGVPALLR